MFVTAGLEPATTGTATRRAPSVIAYRHNGMRDLAPSIVRQRLVIEGTCAAPIDDLIIREYLHRLSVVCDMHVLLDPVTHHSDRYGWAGWVHWETSGAHCYAWDNPLFFSVDIYTCKRFDAVAVVDFTRRFLGALDIASKSF
jgi:S-adenosylmethionine decarboxylase